MSVADPNRHARVAAAATGELQLIALPGVPAVEPGDDLPLLLHRAIERAGLAIAAGDVLVLAQKIVSKAEGRFVELSSVTPGADARRLAATVDKDPRLVELILRESVRVVRSRPGVLIVEHRIGLVLANAGIDHSNVAGADQGRVLLLPEDPDRSATSLRRALAERAGIDGLGLVIADSLGRPWRLGTTGTAIGCAGLPSLVDLRGDLDLEGRELQVTEVGHADQIAAAASLLMGQGAEGRPAVLVRGLPRLHLPTSPARALVRPAELDLFR